MTAIEDHSRTSYRAAPAPASPVRRFLLFAGPDQTPGGLRDFVALFEDEADARSAFAAVRLATENRVAWAELGSVDSAGKLSILCWFGHDRPRRPVPPVADQGRSPLRRPRFWRRRTKRDVPGRGLVG